MAASTPALAQRPAPVPRSADWLVLALVVAALALGWLLRAQTLFATRAVTVEGLQLAIPARALARTEDGRFAATAEGLTVLASRIAPPPVGTADLTHLASSRTLEQGKTLPLYRAVGATPTTVAGHPAVVLEYAYVRADGDGFFATLLEVVHGYELLIAQDDRIYALALEAAEGQWEDVQALWPRLLDSVRL